METMRHLLCCGADPNKADSAGQSPLHWSIYSHSEACLELLLCAKANIELRDVSGRTPLSMIAAEGFREGIEMPLVNTLLRHGADVETQDENGQRPLYKATIKDCSLMTARLLTVGADINAIDTGGFTSLHYALFWNTHQCLILLLDDINLDSNARDPYSATILHYAAYHADTKSLHILGSKSGERLEYPDTDQYDDEYSAIRYAIWRKDFNDEWAIAFERSPDHDPYEWYTAFDRLCKGTSAAKASPSKDLHKIENGDSRPSSDKHTAT